MAPLAISRGIIICSRIYINIWLWCLFVCLGVCLLLCLFVKITELIWAWLDVIKKKLKVTLHVKIAMPESQRDSFKGVHRGGAKGKVPPLDLLRI